MTEQRLRAFFDAWNAQDVEAIVGFFTPDGAYYASIGPDDRGTGFTGTDELRRGVTAFLGAYVSVRYTDLDIVLAGDRAHATWTFAGVRADGIEVTYRGVDVFAFEDDRIKLKDAYRKERAAPVGG